MRTTTSIQFSLLCLFLGVTEANAAWWSFSFGNLLFKIFHCGPIEKHKGLCGFSSCGTSNDPSYCKASDSSTFCSQLYNSESDYESCMAAMADAGITSSSDGSSGSGYDTDAAANYDSSSSEGTRVNDNTQTSGRRSWLMLIIAAAVATTFLALWVWKKRHDDALKNKELAEELNSDGNLHGALAKRTANPDGFPLDRNGTNTSFVSTKGNDTYAMAMV